MLANAMNGAKSSSHTHAASRAHTHTDGERDARVRTQDARTHAFHPCPDLMDSTSESTPLFQDLKSKTEDQKSQANSSPLSAPPAAAKCVCHAPNLGFLQKCTPHVFM